MGKRCSPNCWDHSVFFWNESRCCLANRIRTVACISKEWPTWFCWRGPVFPRGGQSSKANNGVMMWFSDSKVASSQKDSGITEISAGNDFWTTTQQFICWWFAHPKEKTWIQPWKEHFWSNLTRHLLPSILFHMASNSIYSPRVSAASWKKWQPAALASAFHWTEGPEDSVRRTNSSKK